MHLDPETNECIPDALDPVVVEPPVIESPAMVEALTLGEPFADYDSFDDCVAKNADKEDPEAYCASIQQQTEGETKETIQVLAATPNDVKNLRRLFAKELLDRKNQQEDVQERFKRLDTALDCNNKTFKSLRTGIQSLRKQQQRIAGKLNEVITTRPTPQLMDYSPILKAINETRDTLHQQMVDHVRNEADLRKQAEASFHAVKQQLTTYESALKNHLGKIQSLTKTAKTLPTMASQIKQLTKATKPLTSLQEQVTALKDQMTAQGNEYETFKTVVNNEYAKIQEEHAANLSEKDGTIEDLSKKLEEASANTVKETEGLSTRVDNLEAQVADHPVFKGTQKHATTETGLPAPKPWKQKGEK